MDEDYSLRMKVIGNAYDREGRGLIIDEAEDFCESHFVTDIRYINNNKGELWKIVVTYRENQNDTGKEEATKCIKAKHVLTMKDWMEPIEDTEKYFDLWAVSDDGTEVNIGLLTNGIADECADFEVVKVRESPKSDNVIEIRIDMGAETAREIIRKHNSIYRTEQVSQHDCVQTFQNQNTAMQGVDLTQITGQK